MAALKGTLLKISATEYLYEGHIGGITNNGDGTFTFYYDDAQGAPATRTVPFTERDLQRIFTIIPVSSL